MLLKRYIPIGIVAFFGALTLSAWFIDNETIETFANDDATQFFDIIAAFAVFLGALNLLKLQFIKVLNSNLVGNIALLQLLHSFLLSLSDFLLGVHILLEKRFTSVKALQKRRY